MALKEPAILLLGSLLLLGGGAASAQTETSTAWETAPAEPGEDALWLEEDEGSSFEFDRRPSIVEAIEVLGNEATERSVILRRILLRTGDLVNDDLIEESRLRLLGTGFFKEVHFSLRRGSRRGLVVLVIEILERNTITLDGLYLGGSSVSPFFAGLGILERNFLGRGISAGAGFVLGRNRRAFDLHFFAPDLSNTPLQISGSAILVQSGRETVDEAEPKLGELAYSRAGGTLGLGLGVGASQRVSLDYRLESIHADRFEALSPVLVRQLPAILFDESVLSSISLTYERDIRDDPWVPYNGHRIVLSVETGTALLGSSYEFTKYTAEGQLAFPGFSNHAVSLRLLGGLVQGQTPFFNQFFLADHAYFAAGRDSLPRALQLNFSESNDYDDLLISASAEYSIPIQSGGEWVYRTFLYAGFDISATSSLDEAQEDPSGRGSGGQVPISVDLGLRFDTYVGPFTLSLAYLFELGV